MDQTASLEVFASRTFEVDGEGTFFVRIGRPWLEADGETWHCDVAVDAPTGGFQASICGADSLQALILAMQWIAAHVECSAENQAGRLTWFGQREDLGLPPRLPPPALPLTC